MDAELRTAFAEAADVNIRRTGHLPKETGLAIEDRRRPCQAASRQGGRKDRISSCLGIGESFPVGQRLHSRLCHRDMVVDGETDRMRQPLGTEFHELARSERYRRQAENWRGPSP